MGERHSVAALLVMLLVLSGDPCFFGFSVRVKEAAIQARATSPTQAHTHDAHTLASHQALVLLACTYVIIEVILTRHHS